jgi:hypothetical protein
MRFKAYKNASIYKESIERWYDKRLEKKEFKEGDKVLLYNLRFKTFETGKLQPSGTDLLLFIRCSPMER